MYGDGRYRHRHIRPARIRDKHERALGNTSFPGSDVSFLDPAVYADHVVKNDG